MDIDYSCHLPKEFYLRKPETVAKELLGKLFVLKTKAGEILAGKIVETEAYLSSEDLSSHSAPGLTRRNAPMFSEGGILYVYKIYGIHHCTNIVTESEGVGSAVLIRALEPVEGIEIMKAHRKVTSVESLCKGPANLTKALNLTTNDNFRSLLSPELFVQNFEKTEDQNIITTRRIGITKSSDLPLRYYICGSKYVSGKKNHNKLLFHCLI